MRAQKSYMHADESVSWMAYSLDNEANITITGNTTLSGLPDGLHNITVYANDTAGNMGASEMVYFRIETPAPFPTWIVAAIVTMIAGVGVAILIYFAKVKKQLRNSNNNSKASIVPFSTTIHDNNTISSHRLQKNDGRKQTFKV